MGLLCHLTISTGICHAFRISIFTFILIQSIHMKFSFHIWKLYNFHGKLLHQEFTCENMYFCNPHNWQLLFPSLLDIHCIWNSCISQLLPKWFCCDFYNCSLGSYATMLPVFILSSNDFCNDMEFCFDFYKT